MTAQKIQLNKLSEHIENLTQCRLCPNMIQPVVVHRPISSKIYLCGQAPGPHEGRFGKPFAWTAGKTLFRWIGELGIDEETFRQKAYMGAVCRCFPGKNPKGGDRVPSETEIYNCSNWMIKEFKLLKPELVIPVGRLAIEQFLGKEKLNLLVGKTFQKNCFGITCDIVPLPHPSGASTWFKVEPGKSLLSQALILLKEHATWQNTFY